MDDDTLGGIIVSLFLIGIVLYIVLLFITYVLMPTMGIGILIGGGKAIHNYSISFKNNVKPEHI